MGIFSLFGKKDDQQEKPADKACSHAKQDTSMARQRSDGGKSSARPPAKRDAQAARATALKIDAIESEMSSEFRTTTPPRPANTSQNSQPAPKERPLAEAKEEKAPAALAEIGAATDFLLNGSSTMGSVAVASSEVPAVVEEAAVMFANGQYQVVEQILQAAIEEDPAGNALLELWLMLFDLYQITGKQQQFEALSIAYASKFETSPPAWIGNACRHLQKTAPSGATPTIPFSGKLDVAATKIIDRIQKQAETHHALRLEFARITEVDRAGCGLLLNLLMKLQKSGHELILVGALALVEKIRATIEVGRRDDGEDAWLLLLEILQLLNRERDFEEASIDYCVTFEVSPPAFVAPQNKISTATEEAAPVAMSTDGFMMPPMIEGRIDDLILSIAAYSDEHNPAIIDCSGLIRVDFNAAGRLLTGLSPFCGNGRTIEFHHVNHLVTVLFDVIGLKDIVRIIPRKN
ncbi:MAG TPA: STAS domain-containing protein [Noviherbaspirillum sp.]